MAAAIARAINDYAAGVAAQYPDRPYDMGETDPVGLVEVVPGLTEGDRRAILGGNAAALLGIS